MGSLAARRKQSAAAAAAAAASTANSSSNSKPPIAPGTAAAAAGGAATNATSTLFPPEVANRLHAFTSEEINQLLDNNITQPHSLLLIDIRSFVHYSHLHIHSAINVSIPNTILKRPSFTLDKVSEVIVSDQQREAWRRWPQFAHIILYDQASEALQESHNAITYLCIKFHQANYQGTLGYLKGGMSSFSAKYPSRCANAPVTNNSRSKGLNLGMATMAGPMTPGLSGLPSSPATALTLSSLANGASSDVSSLQQTSATTTAAAASPTTTTSRKRGPGLHLGSLPPSAAPGPFTAPTVGLNNQQFNPFFSNIRQNMELSHGSIKERFPIRLPPSSSCQVDMATGRVTKRQLRQGLSAVPSWLRDMFSSNDGPRKLAELYEIIERTEQRRLQSVMAHHSKATSNLAEHPFSIVAGIEMGALNRYTNIWPFEYTRVKLKTCSSGSTGYINASFIEYIDCDPATIASPSSSLGSVVPNLRSLTEQRKTSPTGRQYRRYISTQGPLPATFGDFWTVVWEQETRVIVMLTKEEEMNRIKCHRYWPSSVGESVTYGPIKLTFVSETTHAASSPQGSTDDQTLIREFTIEKDQEKRTVHHIQYMGWMDFGVPDNPIGTLELVKLADDIQTKWDHEGEGSKKAGPMIVHCSAGCGRAGAFCAIDTVIHRLRSLSCLDRLSEAERSGQLDVMYQTVAKFREQRVSMVQTLRQFVFCYEAILWWILGYG
ncbi:protein-tyrosine phosphatase-like protein [Zychaea mexicana]|uniref:protein-tyrosine phosphatase-like protein n=1 Tax=Zychaea mexicana TaxID=64656 RepID=UPI0022FE3C4D|nr:protein-tyrosine phosphatase-like protein [Zychaea mexicana]KAI9499166.1 protein-tyrosine phosphatase-like protein [Zychaea mexicana]